MLQAVQQKTQNHRNMWRMRNAAGNLQRNARRAVTNRMSLDSTHLHHVGQGHLHYPSFCTVYRVVPVKHSETMKVGRDDPVLKRYTVTLPCAH